MSPITRSKNLLVEKFSPLGLLVIGGAFCIVGLKIYTLPWFRRRKAAQAEEFANIIYEEQKRRALQENENSNSSS